MRRAWRRQALKLRDPRGYRQEDGVSAIIADVRQVFGAGMGKRRCPCTVLSDQLVRACPELTFVDHVGVLAASGADRKRPR